MSRYSDARPAVHLPSLPPLPVIDWSRIGAEAPKAVPIDYKGKDAPLPEADTVVLTWTSAEWSAFDHVFRHSDSVRGPYARSWREEWYLFSRNAPASPEQFPLWGWYQMAEICGRRVLLVRSGAHLAYSPWLTGLEQMLSEIFVAKPQRFLSIGTAGGATERDLLGDTAVTNSGHLRMDKPENLTEEGKAINNKTFTCESWFPSQRLFEGVECELLIPLSSVCTHPELTALVEKLHESMPASRAFGAEDLVNAPLDPQNLGRPKAIVAKDQPLLSTDKYFIAKGDDAEEFCALEMDDAVIAQAAGEAGIEYAFFRNISDPIVPFETSSGETIPDEVRHQWSSSIYDSFGFHTSYNGALLAWAALAADK